MNRRTKGSAYLVDIRSWVGWVATQQFHARCCGRLLLSYVGHAVRDLNRLVPRHRTATLPNANLTRVVPGMHSMPYFLLPLGYGGSPVRSSMAWAGRLGILNSEILTFVRRPCNVMVKTTRLMVPWRVIKGHGGVVEPKHAWKLQTREPRDPIGFHIDSLRIATTWNDQKTFRTVTLI